MVIQRVTGESVGRTISSEVTWARTPRQPTKTETNFSRKNSTKTEVSLHLYLQKIQNMLLVLSADHLDGNIYHPPFAVFTDCQSLTV